MTVIDRARRDQHLAAFQVMDVTVFQQVIEHRNSIRIERTAQSLRHHIQVRTGCDEKRSGLKIPAGRGSKSERSGLFIEAQSHHGCFKRRDRSMSPPKLLDEKCNRSPNRFNHRLFRITCTGCMWFDVVIKHHDFDRRILHARFEHSDPIRLFRIDEYQLGDL